MFYWRLTSIVFLIIGIFLFVQSLLMQNISFFYFALICYGMASLIWITIQNLYVNFSMPKNPKNDTDMNVAGAFAGFDIIDFFDIVLSLPKIIFLFLIHTIHN